MAKTIEIHLKERLKEKDCGQKQLAEMTGLTERTISELVNGKTKRYPKQALEAIATALDLKDINELLTLEDEGS
ncbi:helix-turn-helix domain-containing protein [Halobacillus naozhouensis]|uniref:Helix-turn-helix transcriptional regulator n=1 Tax=Halobacillus naozhouensis TaxID=554880 RepID=A0ABY8J1L1_9BACI|nr:helix-turn-helix transcriptional regulator [Halobacillus naozhouensis]WFT74876.1 helix-turn-helix transcriptional regulator [Halobacillus naozhouensis]